MNLREIKTITTPVAPRLSLGLIENYVDTFIDKTSHYYTKFFSISYSGSFLWDCLVDRAEIVSFEQVQTSIYLPRKVYVVWQDLLSTIFFAIDDESIFTCENLSTIITNLHYFPKDLYVFDSSMKWTVIQSHFPFNEQGHNWKLIQL
jgi:hypothetical protein